MLRCVSMGDTVPDAMVRVVQTYGIVVGEFSSVWVIGCGERGGCVWMVATLMARCIHRMVLACRRSRACLLLLVVVLFVAPPKVGVALVRVFGGLAAFPGAAGSCCCSSSAASRCSCNFELAPLRRCVACFKTLTSTALALFLALRDRLA